MVNRILIPTDPSNKYTNIKQTFSLISSGLIILIMLDNITIIKNGIWHINVIITYNDNNLLTPYGFW